MTQKQIDIFEDTITEQLLGPGSDILANDKQCEVITDFPLKRYYTGILFPKKILNNQEEQDTQILDDSQIDTNQTDDAQDAESVLDVEDNEVIKKDIKDDNKEEISLSNHFHPSDMGISFCVDENIEFLVVNFSFATYSEAKQTDASIAMSPNNYNTLIDDKHGFPFKETFA